MINYYVYILQSDKDNNFYVGYTADLERRFAEHRRGHVESTRYRLPLRLLCFEVYFDKREAEAREKFLKSSDGKKDLRKRLKYSIVQKNLAEGAASSDG